jgi:SAM-dependent methyltransferase
MSEALERDVAAHYSVPSLGDKILAGLRAAGIDPARPSPQDLAPVDEFHIGGRPATAYLVAKMGLSRHQHVLDVGCGIGGATRFLAGEIGCRVTGIDLTPEYVEVARDLAERTGLARRITYEVGSALAMPFADSTFDAALTMHVAMNIADREGLYREVARVLAPRAVFAIYDVMKRGPDRLVFPVPWADTDATSHLVDTDRMHALLDMAGFAVETVEDRTEFAVAFFRERLGAAAGAPPPLGLHLLMGANARQKFENMLVNLERGSIAPAITLARRRP